jgi:hypothetical protein
MQATLFDAGRRERPKIMALTVCQPWAWAIAAGHKRVENRTWSTRYRGRLAIHAGLGSGWDDEGRHALESLGINVPENLVRGAIVATCELTDVQPIIWPTGLARSTLAADPLATGPFCWLLSNIEQLAEPIPCRGQQGLFIPPPEVLALLAPSR